MKATTFIVGALALVAVAGTGLRLLEPGRWQQAPHIGITTIEGKHIGLASLHGRPVLINFWATTCPGCVREIPKLTRLYREFAPRGLEVIGIAMAYDPPNHVVAFSKARNIPYPVALDITSNAAQKFGNVRLTPTTFLIAPDGSVTLEKSGQLDMKELHRLIAGMLDPVPAEGHTVAAN